MSDPIVPASEAEIEALFLAFEIALEAENTADAHPVLQRLREALGDDDPDLLYAQAHLVWLEQGADDAEPLLERVIELDDEHAEAHYDLGCLAEENDDEETMVEHFLRVRALDALADKAAGLGTPEDFDRIERMAREVLEQLPEPFVSRLAHVPVLIERRPERNLVEEGFDPRAFGLFDGPTEGVTDVPAPTRIVLYACNLLSEFTELEELREQVEITVLHEVGHFFGLDEDDLQRLGLD